MSRISMIDIENSNDEVKRAVSEHLAQGYRMTNEKRTLLHNVTAFNALEAQSYAVDRVLQQMIGSRAADLFEYAVSVQNECMVCSVYFTKLLRKYNLSGLEDGNLTATERLLIRYGRAIARDPKGVSDALFSEMRKTFSEEEIVVITTMGVFMIANNYFNDILDVEPETLDD